jgi:hypothetical protein
MCEARRNYMFLGLHDSFDSYVIQDEDLTAQ